MRCASFSSGTCTWMPPAALGMGWLTFAQAGLDCSAGMQGLGKTLQVLALLWTMLKQGPEVRQPALPCTVLCRTALHGPVLRFSALCHAMLWHLGLMRPDASPLCHFAVPHPSCMAHTTSPAWSRDGPQCARPW